jgi:ABC-type branched-subunit amino acid transport system substrate-binding protein
MAELAHFMVVLGPTRVFAVTAKSPGYVGLMTTAFEQAARSQGVKVVGSMTIPLGTHNLSALARKLEATPRPAIFTAIPPPYVDQLFAGLRATGVKQLLFGTAVMDTAMTVSSPQATNDAYFSSYGFLRADSAAQKFAADYQRLFHSTIVGGFPGLGLDTIRLLEAAAQHAHSVNPKALGATLQNGLTLTGVGLADRAYARDGNHTPLTQVGIAKSSPGAIISTYAGVPTNVPLS